MSRIGGEYDLKRAWALARTFLRVPPKPSMPLAPGIAETATQFICSSLLAHAFALVGYSILPIGTAHLRDVIPGDFERASVFEVVDTPHKPS